MFEALKLLQLSSLLFTSIRNIEKPAYLGRWLDVNPFNVNPRKSEISPFSVVEQKNLISSFFKLIILTWIKAHGTFQNLSHAECVIRGNCINFSQLCSLQQRNSSSFKPKRFTTIKL